MADPKLIAEARRILEHVTPLAFDCGTLCGHKCCIDFEPDVGVYLIPGELALFDGSEDWLTFDHHPTDAYEFAPSWEAKYQTVPFMKCHSLCRREGRPFECRTYPLVPFLHEDGQIEMRYSPFAKGVCPLTERYSLAQLQPAFVEAAHQAWSLLMQDPEMLDHVRYLTEQLKASELPLIDLDELEEGA